MRTSKDGFAGWDRLGVFRQSLVSVQFESQPNRTLMEIPMKNAYKAIFESGIPIRLATIDAHTESLGLWYEGVGRCGQANQLGGRGLPDRALEAVGDSTTCTRG